MHTIYVVKTNALKSRFSHDMAKMKVKRQRFISWVSVAEWPPFGK